jgi:hypothetical protein
MRHANLRIKRDGLRSETAPSLNRLVQSNVEDGDDPVVAVNDDDLITNDEVHVTAPLGIDLDECRRNLYHAYAGGHRGASAEGEVDVISPWDIPAGQDRLSDLGSLLRCQVDAAARLALTLLSLALLRGLLPGLALPLTGLALLTLLALRRLARALVPLTLLPAILLRALIALALSSLFLLTLGRLTCGLSFLPALRLALLLFLRASLRLTLFVVPTLGLATRRRL